MLEVWRSYDHAYVLCPGQQSAGGSIRRGGEMNAQALNEVTQRLPLEQNVVWVPVVVRYRGPATIECSAETLLYYSAAELRAILKGEAEAIVGPLKKG